MPKIDYSAISNEVITTEKVLKFLKGEEQYGSMLDLINDDLDVRIWIENEYRTKKLKPREYEEYIETEINMLNEYRSQIKLD